MKKTVTKEKASVKVKHPIIHRSCFIHPAATVIGLVELGENTSIWPGAVLRGDSNLIILGKGINIQDNCTLHVDSQRGISIGDFTLVGHQAMIHSCKIGKACLIGIGSIILEGAEIGDGAMITAGCLIRGGTKIPAGAMVIQKNGELKIYENKARVQVTIAGSIGYIDMAKRCRKKIWGPHTIDEERAFYEEAGVVMKELGF
ncbi:MAG: gamma carbonic anhydrase family protein [Leptospira sp.]|nr:gamma carbonic anhydrase family protein [Leptospira sp.]